MSRPIKFRVWLPAIKKLSYPFDLFHFPPEENLVGCPIMQFTGLHDKNGKEIWEGDIIEFDHQDFRKKTGPIMLRAEVVYFWAQFRISAKLPGEFPRIMPHPTLDLDLRINRICEVLGNIHEHPELLK